MYFRFTDFEIDIARHELRQSGAVVHIEPQVFDLIVHLIRNRDRIVGKDELFDVIWEGRIVSEATLSPASARAARAPRQRQRPESHLHGVFKRGFRFVGDVDEENLRLLLRSSEPLRNRRRPRPGTLVATVELSTLSDAPCCARRSRTWP